MMSLWMAVPVFTVDAAVVVADVIIVKTYLIPESRKMWQRRKATRSSSQHRS